MSVRPLLLDTCAVLWLFNKSRLSEASRSAISAAAGEGCLFVSPFSAWEIATLVAKGRIALDSEPRLWFGAAVAHPGVQLAMLHHEILIESCFLPSSPPSDPADRIMIATARHYGLTIVTRDGPILEYSKKGHVKSLGC